MVAKRLRISWNTAQVHLYKLVALGLAKGKKLEGIKVLQHELPCQVHTARSSA